MSHLFERPLCDMGRAYDFAFRPALGDPPVGMGGPCDDRPARIDLLAADADKSSPAAVFRSFFVCPEHVTQLRRMDGQMPQGSRFRSDPAGPPGAPP